MPRIGITGHTNLTEATERAVSAALRELLRQRGPEGLVGVSCLARGADQLFAQAVLDLGGRLEIVLPAPTTERRSNRTTSPSMTPCWRRQTRSR